MKPLSDMTRLELAAFIGAEFKRRNINVVLSGGSCIMKWNPISVILVSGILACGPIAAQAADTNAIVTVKSAQSSLVPRTGVTYRIAANWLYKTDSSGPAEMQNSTAWHLANEFVFRTSLRDLFVLPASSSGNRKDDDLYSVTFARKTDGTQLNLLVDPRRETVQLKNDK